MTVPPGMFAPGGRTGYAKQQERPNVPIEWIKAHPSTRRWWAKTERDTLGAIEVVDTALVLDNGFEGYIYWMTLTGHAGIQGRNLGIGWRIFVDEANILQTLWNVGAGIAPPLATDTAGRFDYLMAGDGAGTSWGQLDIWVQDGATIRVGMNNNGGSTDALGWVMYGYYWPVIIRDEWLARGWRK